MITLVKTTFLLIGFLLFLSVTINEKPIFSYIYKVISPVTTSSQKAISSFFSQSVDNTEKYSKKLFDNSVPRLKDRVGSKMSSNLKNAPVTEPQEKILDSEKRELDQLIKNH